MPPKTPAGGARPRRVARATARKSTPKSSSVSPPPEVPTESPPPTTTPETPALTTSKPSPEVSNEAPESTATTETTAKSTGEVSIEASATSVVPQPDVVTAPPETFSETNLIINEETTERIDPDETLAQKASPSTATETVDETNQETAIEAVAETAAKTVVKKTVRVVKKVVKKKVAKRVQKCQSVSSNQELEKLEVLNNGENPNPPLTVSTEVENPNPSVPVSMEVENPNPIVTVSMDVEIPNKSEVFEGEKSGSVIEVPLEAPVLDFVAARINGDASEKPVSVTETPLEDQNVGLVAERNDECVTGNADSGGGGDVGVKEEVEKCDIGGLKGEVEMSSGVVLSEEMEALERRRRRKTEIFIGGLDKDAKEEDIRKVFEEVGEVVEVRLMMNSQTGKNKGYAFLRYGSASDAKKALAKYPKAEICGKQCGTAPVEGNDTIFLGNIDKKWKNEDVVKMLQEIGIEKIDKVTVMADPSNIECNRGFAFLELETNKDAQNAYKKLQKKDVFGKHQKIKVAWAEPLNEPDEEEMLKVKSVYAEFIPSSWDENKVRDHFKKFGEIDNVVLARNLRSSKRKDFAFVNYTTREAALSCIESLSHEFLNDEGSKVNVKVSLAKPIPKGKQNKRVSKPDSKEVSNEKLKPAQRAIKPTDPRNKGKSTRKNYNDSRVDRRSSTTSELVQLLREQASWRQSQTGSGIGSVNLDYPYSLPGKKRPFSAMGDDPLYSDPRGYPRTRLESSHPMASPSYNALSQGGGTTSLSYYQGQGAAYTSGSLYGSTDHSNGLQRREGAPYHGRSSLYRRY